MRRVRKRDWPVVVYKYRAYIDPASLPEFIWQYAHDQARLWNDLVAYWETVSSDVPTEPGEAKTAFWQQFWAECQDITDGSELNWEARRDVLDRFSTALVTGLKRENWNPPKKKRGLGGRLRLVHRYTGGGWPVEKAFGSRAWRFSILNAPPPGAYSDNSQHNRRRRIVKARFGVDGAIFNFRLRLHRPLPEGAYLKRIAFLGEYRYHPNPRRRWTFHVALWLEVPPGLHTVNFAQDAPVAGLDLGWRKFDDYLRVGFIRDSQGGRFELRLPLDMSNYRTRRDGLPSSWSDKAELDAQIAHLVDQVKADIKPHLVVAPLPQELRRSVGALGRMRQRGLHKLVSALRELADGEYDSENARIALARLEVWQADNRRLAYTAASLARRMVARREWLYNNLAAWLAKNYQAIVWEGELDVKQMAEDKEKGPALKAADRYRQMAAIGRLRELIRRHCAKYGSDLIDGEVKGSTATCSTCGGAVEVGPSRVLVCENGHQLDQDDNAARNFLAQMPPDYQPVVGLRGDNGLGGAGLVIPQELADVVVNIGPRSPVLEGAVGEVAGLQPVSIR